MWKNISLNGWEYLVCWEDLGSSPMNAIIYTIYFIIF